MDYDVIIDRDGPAGLFSEGKLNFIPCLGKTDLTQFMSLGQVQALTDETLLYMPEIKMPEIKFFTAQSETDNNLEISIRGCSLPVTVPGGGWKHRLCCSRRTDTGKTDFGRKRRQGSNLRED